MADAYLKLEMWTKARFYPPKLPSHPSSREGLRLAARLTSRNMGISCCSGSSKIATPDPALTRSSDSGTLPPVHCWSMSGT